MAPNISLISTSFFLDLSDWFTKKNIFLQNDINKGALYYKISVLQKKHNWLKSSDIQQKAICLLHFDLELLSLKGHATVSQKSNTSTSSSTFYQVICQSGQKNLIFTLDLLSTETRRLPRRRRFQHIKVAGCSAGTAQKAKGNEWQSLAWAIWFSAAERASEKTRKHRKFLLSAGEMFVLKRLGSCLRGVAETAAILGGLGNHFRQGESDFGAARVYSPSIC